MEYAKGLAKQPGASVTTLRFRLQFRHFEDMQSKRGSSVAAQAKKINLISKKQFFVSTVTIRVRDFIRKVLRSVQEFQEFESFKYFDFGPVVTSFYCKHEPHEPHEQLGLGAITNRYTSPKFAVHIKRSRQNHPMRKFPLCVRRRRRSTLGLWHGTRSLRDRAHGQRLPDALHSERDVRYVRCVRCVYSSFSGWRRRRPQLEVSDRAGLRFVCARLMEMCPHQWANCEIARSSVRDSWRCALISGRIVKSRVRLCATHGIVPSSVGKLWNHEFVCARLMEMCPHQWAKCEIARSSVRDTLRCALISGQIVK